MSEATYRPSKAARIVQCHASRLLELKYPELEQSEEARLGTILHEAAAGIDHALDDEQREVIDVYLREVRSHELDVKFESYVDCSVVMPGNYGTCDAWAYDKDNDELWLWDLKTGYSWVDVFQNWQLLDYAAGLCDILAPNEHRMIRMNIVQPRSYDKRGPVRRWAISQKELFGKYVPIMKQAFAKSHYSDATAMTGDECKDCSSSGNCTALQRAAFSAADMSIKSDSHELKPHELGTELSILHVAADRLAKRIHGLEVQATARMKSGVRVPGYHLEQGLGRQKWTDVEAVKLMFGQSVVKTDQLITPKQAIKLGCDPVAVESFTITPPGEVKLMQDGTQLTGVFSND
jgi:hypothetical protein